MQAEVAHDLPVLAGISAVFRWLEDFVTLVSGPVLTAGLAIALIDLLTDGKLLASEPMLLYAWAVSQALGVDGQLIGASVRAGRAMRSGRYWPMAGYMALIVVLGYVAYQAADVFATQQALGLPTQAALRQLGMSDTGWILERAAITVGLVILAGFLRYETPRKAAIESPEERAKREAYELAQARHRNELRALKAAGLRQVAASAMGRDKTDDTPDNAATDAPSITEDSAPDMPPDGGGNGTGKRRLKAVTGSQWTKRELQEYASRRYAQNISDEQAVAMVRMLGNGKRMGRAYVAHKKSVMAAIDRQYASASREANAAG